MNKIFVYGTLKPGISDIYFGEGKNPLEGLVAREAEIDGDIHVIPGTHVPAVAKLGTGNRIKGFVYEVDDQVLEMMHRIEGYPAGPYQYTPVQTTAGEDVNCYVFNRPDILIDELRIAHGVYEVGQTPDRTMVILLGDLEGPGDKYAYAFEQNQLLRIVGDPGEDGGRPEGA